MCSSYCTIPALGTRASRLLTEFLLTLVRMACDLLGASLSDDWTRFEAPLTRQGHQQARRLAEFIVRATILRAKSIQPGNRRVVNSRQKHD